MPPFSTPNNILHAMSQPDFDHSFMQQHEDLRKTELATSDWSNAQLYSFAPLASTPHRLNVKTHVFKKELQEYIPTQIEDRLRIETIIYVELSIVDQVTGALANTYDYVRLPKDLFLTQADKVMSSEEMATKRILNIAATLQCPSNGWQEEKEACLRCARRMSAKSDATESRIMHMLPELHRTQEGDELISFRSGIANIQFKINCYCGHKREKEGFVIRFDSQSDASISSHVTLPLMFYHQNKNRVASRALAAAAKAQAKAEQQDQQSVARNIVKSVNSKSKREPRSHGGRGPIGDNHQIPSPPNSLIDSPTQTWSSSPEMDEFMDSSDLPFTVPSPPPPDPVLSLFHDNTTISEIQPKPQAMITHMTPNSGPTRGGTLVTIHGSNFTVGEVVYVSFGQTLVPIFPQRDHILECFTPAALKADTVPVFVVDASNDSHAVAANSTSQITFTYVDDNEKELIKLALQRMMNITARMNGPLENVLHRAHDFALWNDLLEGSSLDSSNNVYQNLEKMVLQSLELVDPVSSGSSVKNCEHLSMVNSTGHTMLHLAVALQYQVLVKDLVDRGADLELADKNGMTALDWARHVNNDALVALLSGMEVVVKDVSPMVAKDLTLATGLTKGVEVAQHLQSLENPSVGVTHGPPTDSRGGIVPSGQLDGSPPGHVKLQGIASGHADPPMNVPWEGFGQGPGPADALATVAGSKVLEVNKVLGLFDGSQRPDESEPVDVYQAPQDLPDRREVALAKGQPPQDPNSAISLPLLHKYDASLMSAPNQDHSPVPQRRLPIAGVVFQSAGVSQEREMNIPILPVAGAICPIVGIPPPVVRQPIGDFDHRAPFGQGVVAEGCTGGVEVPLKDTQLPPCSKDTDMSVGVPGTSFGHQSAGIQQHQSLSQEHQASRIQSTSRIDVAMVAGVRTPIQQNNDTVVQDGVIDVVNNDCAHASPAGIVGEVVVMDDVDNKVVGSSTVVEGVSVKQAAVQSGRFDVSEHPLFLGGLPVLPRDISRVKPPRTEMQDQTMEGEHMKDTEQDGDVHDEVRRA
ncbi:hypothetical protein MVEG_07532 [Podila verticillata NRRL 6337]|nr:hypothetical protein MVEG_07532 [Podila verticillata NRRL 6337]